MEMNTRYILMILSLFVCTRSAYAQVEMNDYDTNTEYVSGVVLHADPRLDIITKNQKSSAPITGYITSGRGFRVQIYGGNDRVKAMSIKNDFMRRFPAVKTYLTYVQPQFRVKVGDFKTRAEAQSLYEETSAIYTPCMIVPDIVKIKSVDNE